MANRGIRELLALATFDYRFYLGNINDYSGNGNDALWQAGMEPIFRRDIGGVVGLDFPLAGGDLIASPAGMTTNGPFAYELMMMSRSSGDALAGRIIDPVDGNCTLRWNGPNLRIDCGVAWNVTAIHGPPLYVIVTRDSSNDALVYYNGAPFAGPFGVGGNNINAQIRIGNWAAGTRVADAIFYSIRLLQGHIDPDEVTRLYEFSRPKNWPGAWKRSGIISPVV